MIDSLLRKLAGIAEIEFADIVIGWDIAEGKLRLYFADKSFLDVWFSRQLKGRYASKHFPIIFMKTLIIM